MPTATDKGLGSRLYDVPIIGLFRRLLVSALIAVPFLLGGAYGFIVGDFPIWASITILLVGAALMALGMYMSLIGVVPTPGLVPGEQQLVMRHPAQKPAYARMIFSIPFFLGALYLLEFTEFPYIYPFIPFVLGMYLFFKGAMRYLRNLHITYTVTDRRIVHMYRFLWLNTKEIPVARIISISESRSFFEIITGRGSVIVASGIGERQVIRIEEINDPGPVAETLRSLLPS